MNDPSTNVLIFIIFILICAITATYFFEKWIHNIYGLKMYRGIFNYLQIAGIIILSFTLYYVYKNSSSAVQIKPAVQICGLILKIILPILIIGAFIHDYIKTILSFPNKRIGVLLGSIQTILKYPIALLSSILLLFSIMEIFSPRYRVDNKGGTRDTLGDKIFAFVLCMIVLKILCFLGVRSDKSREKLEHQIDNLRITPL